MGRISLLSRILNVCGTDGGAAKFLVAGVGRVQYRTWQRRFGHAVDDPLVENTRRPRSFPSPMKFPAAEEAGHGQRDPEQRAQSELGARHRGDLWRHSRRGLRRLVLAVVEVERFG
jgi:hypothetical protein